MEYQELRTKLLSEDISTYKTLVAKLPHERLGRIAASFLDGCIAEMPVGKEVTNVSEIAADPSRWAQGHAAFDLVRERILERESKKASPNDPSYHVLFVAENVARVVYNATEPLDPFDDDSAAWLVMTYVQLSRCLRSSTLVERALNVLKE